MSSHAELSVSVVIPVYNGAIYLGEAIDSIIQQTYLPSEIVVVDDGSTDGSGDLIQQIAFNVPIQIRYVYQTNQGVGVARNKGVNIASGSWVAFLDQDDIWLPTKLARQVEVIERQPEAEIVIVKQRFFMINGFSQPHWVRPGLCQRELTGFTPSAIFAKRSLFSRIGLFEEAIKLASDTDWIARLFEANVPIFTVDEVLLLHRIHPQNQSRFVATSHREILDIVRRSVHRKQELELNKL